jgi:hypothetical protein
MTQPATIVIDDVRYVREDSVNKLSASKEGLRYAIIRCRDAGVHAGWVSSVKERTVVLLDSRRLWKWHGKTLSGLATEGTTNKERCKYANTVPEIVLLDACEVIYCTNAGMNSILCMKEWLND